MSGGGGGGGDDDDGATTSETTFWSRWSSMSGDNNFWKTLARGDDSLLEKLQNPEKWAEMASARFESSSSERNVDKILMALKNPSSSSSTDNLIELVGKLKLTMNHAQELLGKESELSLMESLKSISFIVRYFDDFLNTHPTAVRDIAVQDGAREAEKEDLVLLDKYAEMANAAYDEWDKDESMDEFFLRKNQTLLYFDEKTDYELTAHFISFDPEAKICIVGVKGTSTMSDVLTDILCRTTKFLDESINAHDGIKNAALRLCTRIESTIMNLFVPLDFEIVFTGHSLGAGVAALSALFFKKKMKVERVRAITFATPPVLDKKAALDCKDFVTSLVNNRDVIPRTSLSNMNIMQETILAVHEMLKDGTLSTESVSSNEHEVEGRDPIERDEILGKLRTLQDEYKLEFENDLYIPGRVFYFFHQRGDAHVLKHDGTLTGLRQMVLSRKMLLDHQMSLYSLIIRDTLFHQFSFHSVITPPLLEKTDGIFISIPEFRGFNNPKELKEVVHYKVLGTVLGKEIRTFSAWRRWSEFDRLNMDVKNFIHVVFPSPTFSNLQSRRGALEEYLSTAARKASRKNIGELKQLLIDFIGAGKRAKGPDYVLKNL